MAPWPRTIALIVALAALGPAAAAPQSTPPPTVPGYVITMETRAIAPEVKAPPASAPEAQALMDRLRGPASLKSRFWIAQDLSRQEILSTDFVLPAGTVVLHKAGDKFYVIADPRAKTYLVMDSEQLLNALEGGAGIINSQYTAKVVHTEEKKLVAGVPCRKSIVTVTYVSAIPFENDRMMVQQQNELEVWHTSDIVSSATFDHFFFKFQRDKTGAVQKLLATELGFPMEVNLIVTQGTGRKSAAVQPGSLHAQVLEVRKEKELDSELLRIPPAGYRRVEKSPYFKDGAAVRIP
jgi:hypothetical protein